MNQIATIEQPQASRSVIVAMAMRYGMEPAAFEQTLRATVVPKDCSKEQFAAFLLVAKEYNLNPITKEIYAFPKQGGGIQPIVSVDGWANLVNSHPQCDGLEFQDALTDAGEIVSITCRIYRKDRTHPTSATEYMSECKRETVTWKQWPRRMLRHKALIQAARYAFGFAGIVEPDEAERGHYDGAPGMALVPPPAPPGAPTILTPPPAKPRAAPRRRESAPAVETQTALPGDWGDYLDRMKDELTAAKDGKARKDVVDTVADAVMGALERSELDDIQAALINGAWGKMSENAEGSG